MPYEADKKHLTLVMWLGLLEIASGIQSWRLHVSAGTLRALEKRELITLYPHRITAKGADIVRRAEALKIEEDV